MHMGHLCMGLFYLNYPMKRFYVWEAITLPYVNDTTYVYTKEDFMFEHHVIYADHVIFLPYVVL